MAQRAINGQHPSCLQPTYSCIGQPACGDGGCQGGWAGAKGAERQHEESVATHDLQATIRRKKCQKKADARKGRKVAKDCVSNDFGAPEIRKVSLPKGRVRSQLAG